MSKPAHIYVCQDCGASYAKWQGRCEACGAWNGIVEEASVLARPGRKAASKSARVIPLADLKGAGAEEPRMLSGIAEFDRALGGGLVAGSAVLVAGDPGIGKSTLLLEAMARYGDAGQKAVYISGEEAPAQIQMRASRLGIAESAVGLGAETDVSDILKTLDELRPAVVVIDSIQTLFLPSLESAPGTVAQVRAGAQALITLAKQRGIALFLIGHVTKEGQIAGPRVLEHMVDTVLYFEGERAHQYRILRAVKNRFGSADEIGVFEMTGRGLEEVANPSALFLAGRRAAVPGSAVFAGMEGSRPLLVEIQALVAPTMAANPRRAVLGWDSGRLAMVLAVLDARAGLGLGGLDVYLNVAGGLKITEPAADLAVAAALASAHSGRPIPAETVVFGEISLSGDIRPVAQAGLRLKEAQKLGFESAWLPAGQKLGKTGLKVTTLERLADLVELTEGSPEQEG